MVKSMQQAPAPHATPSQPSQPLPTLHSPEQAAQLLGVAEADVLAALDAGDLKGKKIGSTWRITQAALDAFLAE
jgi:excisionase family DNA binding protein